jgi:hypothetical protein
MSTAQSVGARFLEPALCLIRNAPNALVVFVSALRHVQHL